MYLRRLCDEGLLRRVARGLYALAEAEPGSGRMLAEAAKRVPGGVVCLLSALEFHGLTTQAPFQVWIAIDTKAWKPRASGLPLRVTRFSGRAFTEGAEMHEIERVPVKVYSPAKTVADCFKYRNKIGLDVAIESLRDGLSRGACSVDDLWRFARICRVANVMRPYLEALA